MRGINDQRPARGDDLLQLVDNLTGNPDLVIHLRRPAQDNPVGFLLSDDVDCRRQIRGGGPGLSDIADE